MRWTQVLAGCVLVLWTAVGSADAQDSFPEQFYTNGEKVDAWKRDPGAAFMTTLWFARSSPDDLAYRQVIIYVFDDRPGEPLYRDAITRKFIGRFDEESGGYSMLPEEFRRTRLGEIPESAFPDAGEMPTLGEMLRALGEAGADNENSMMKPPVTKTFPRLETSAWDSHYVTASGARVIASLEFDGNQGMYQPQGSSDAGSLSNIGYQREVGGALRITGHWHYRGSSGHFKFRLAPSDLNTFTGEWGFDGGAVEGIWDGVRTSR